MRGGVDSWTEEERQAVIARHEREQRKKAMEDREQLKQRIEGAIECLGDREEIDATVNRKFLYTVLRLINETAEPAEPELEGGGHTWFYVCGECHGLIGDRDRYCRWCGRKQKWDEHPEGDSADRPAGD